MADLIVPVSRSLYLCDSYTRHPEGRIDLAGMFTTIRPAIYPHVRRLVAFVQLSGGWGDTPLFFEVRREHGDELLRTTAGRTIQFTDQRFSVERGDDPGRGAVRRSRRVRRLAVLSQYMDVRHVRVAPMTGTGGRSMTQDQPHQPDDATSGGQLFEFVDEAHEVTEEERNRPRYGRPVRQPANGPPEAAKPADAPPTPESK